MPHGTPGHDIPRSGDGRFGSLTAEDLEALTARAGLTPGQGLTTRAAAALLGFRTTSYVTDELIDWSAAPEDPVYRLVFPDGDMLPAVDVNRIADMLRRHVPRARIAAVARQARSRLVGDHVPPSAGNVLPGAYRTCRDTVMIFPARRPSPRPSGISCFDGVPLRTGPGGAMTRGNISRLAHYLTASPQVTCVHFAGHDLLTMAAPALRAYIGPLLQAAHLEAIRVDTSVLAHWPRRFLTDPDAGDTLRLLSQVAASGKTLALTARFSHTRQLQSQLIGDSVRQVRGTGAVIRTQVPLIGSVNDDADLLADMWRAQVRLGMVPDSVVIERGPGPDGKFAVPLAGAHDIFGRAYAQVSGLARTARGPATPTAAGTVCITGIADIAAQKAFVLHYTQASDQDLIGRPFFAAFDPAATWFTDLKPVPGAAFPGQLRADPRHPGRQPGTGRRTRSARAALRPGSLVIARPAPGPGARRIHGSGPSRRFPTTGSHAIRRCRRPWREQQVSIRGDMLPRRQRPSASRIRRNSYHAATRAHRVRTSAFVSDLAIAKLSNYAYYSYWCQSCRSRLDVARGHCGATCCPRSRRAAPAAEGTAV